MSLLVRRKNVAQVLRYALKNSLRLNNNLSNRPRIFKTDSVISGTGIRSLSFGNTSFQIAAPKPAETVNEKSSHLSNVDSIDKILHTISLNVQRTGRIYLSDITTVQNLIEKCGSCTPSHALLLLRCGGELLVDERKEERISLVSSLWSQLERLKVPLDISHYNALLRTYIENEHRFSPLEFLSTLESKIGLEPNRVTYQFLVARFCHLGDILGATTILEHMKEKELTVNEHVFHSLIIGHCRNGDFESAEGILKMMSESGIDVGSGAYVSLFMGMARGGKSWEEISLKITEANNSNVILTDNDLFRIANELILSNNKEGARKAVDAVPRSRGFFQEMRNAIPKMIFGGDVDLAFDLLKSFKTPTIADENHKDAASKDHGFFFLKAMVKSEHDPEKVVEILKKFANEAGDVSSHACRLADICVDLNKDEYGPKLADTLREKFGNEIFNPSNFVGFIRSRTKQMKSEDEMIRLLKTFESMNIQLSLTNISNDVIPFFYKDASIIEPLKNLTKILDNFNQDVLSNRRKIYTNCLIQYLLNLENIDGLYSVTRMAVFTNLPARSSIWSASLARSYLATGNEKLLAAILYNLNDHVQSLKREKEVMVVTDPDLFSTLVHIHGFVHKYRPLEDPDEVVMRILNECKQLKLGIPEQTAELLRPVMAKTESSGPLLDETVAIYKDRSIHLTKDRIERTVNDQRTFLQSNFDSLLKKYDSMKSKETAEKSPKSVGELEKIQSKLINNNIPAGRITSDLITEYISEGQLEKIKSALEAIQKQNTDFAMNPMSIGLLINRLLEEGKVDEAFRLLTQKDINVLSTVLSKSKKFMGSFTSVAIELAKAGKDDEVIELLESINKEDVVFGMLMSYVSGILSYYANEKRTDMAQKTADILLKKDLVQKAGHISPLINAYLNVDDAEGAVVALEKMSKILKRLPGKTALMEYLIKKGDMDRMQRVLDASINVVGEEKSLYDLAMNFLTLGKTSQARKLLETPGLRYNHEKAVFITNFFTENEMFTALENFVFLSQSVFNCDREFLFSTLAKVYKDDCTKMNEVWVRMQEDGYVPSDKLKCTMAIPFIVKEKPIPFHVPLEELKKTEINLISKKTKVELPDGAPNLLERYAAFDSAVENGDLNTALAEFLAIAEDGTYISSRKVRMVIELCCKKSAWNEASSCIKAVIRRDLSSHLTRTPKAVNQVLDNLGQREIKSISELVTGDKFSKLFDLEKRMMTSA